MSAPPITLRAAAPGDIDTLNRLIADSARALGEGYYTPAQTQAAIDRVFGVDSELVADGTYFVAMAGDAIAGCGGWSRRQTLFGGDLYAGRASGLLDPAADAARIRAFFVDPRHARRGIGSQLLAASERAASAAGFSALSLMATLPGVPFYAAHGYRAEPAIALRLDEIDVDFVPMRKAVVAELLQ